MTIDLISVLNTTTSEYVALPCPIEYSPVPQELTSGDGTQRNTSGLLFKDRIAVKWSVALKWSAVTDVQLRTILALTGTDFFTASILSPVTGTNVTSEFYRGSDLSLSPIRRSPTEEKLDYWTVSMTIIER